MGRGAADKKDGNMANDTANDTAAAKKAPVTQFQFAQKPEELPGWEGFKRFMWNGETKQFMGRTGCSWRKYNLNTHSKSYLTHVKDGRKSAWVDGKLSPLRMSTVLCSYPYHANQKMRFPTTLKRAKMIKWSIRERVRLKKGWGGKKGIGG